MSQTVIRGTQILNNTVQRQDLDTSTVGQAVVTKLVQGSGITLSSTGADAGTGDVTVTSPDVVSTDAGNIATLGTDNHILVPQSQIWSVRLRSFNAVGNPTFEVDQRNAGTVLINPASGIFCSDRWQQVTSGVAINTQQEGFAAIGTIKVPGTSFAISQNDQNLGVNTSKASLAASDYCSMRQFVEGPSFRELSGDVHSLSLLVNSGVAPLSFSVFIVDNPGTKTLVKLCTVSTPSTWTLITLPNLPAFPSGNFSLPPGNIGYIIGICLSAGSSMIAPAAGTWQNGNFMGAPGMSNWHANPANTAFRVALIQHEPGPQCTTPMDCPFGQNLDGDMGCTRYYQKSVEYSTKFPATSGLDCGQIGQLVINTNGARSSIRFAKGMAKAPTVIIADSLGTLNAATVEWIGSTTVSSLQGVTSKGVYNIVFPSTLNPSQGGTPVTGQWQADTGM